MYFIDAEAIKALKVAEKFWYAKSGSLAYKDQQARHGNFAFIYLKLLN